MKDFLDLIETVRSQDADVTRLFGDAGRSVRPTERQAAQAGYQQRLCEAIKFIDEVSRGKRPAYHLREAMTTADFPQLFGDVLDRQLLADYVETTPAWQSFCKRGTVPDFRTVRRFRVDGAEAHLDAVLERAPYPLTSVADAEYTYSVAKYGKRIPFSWETMVNDDLDALKDIPARFARSARRTEDRFATNLIADTNGPHATMFAAGNRNIVSAAYGAVSNNPALSIAGLQDGMTVLGNMLDTDSEPIVIEAAILIVPPALALVAQNILNALEIIVGVTGTATQILRTTNWMKSKVELIVNPYLPLISTTNGATSWYLFASPSNGRPAVEIGFLRGHESPEIFMKSPNATRVGGGGEDAMNGDFDTDSIEYKIRHVLGGTRLDPKMAVASNGSGA
jgi:hypothetical protein